jgi:chromosome segregation ATPase
MKSRARPPIESPETSYTPNVRANDDQYKTSLSRPSWPKELPSDATLERKLVRAEMALDDVARREQILAGQVKSHRECVAELAEERALFDAERAAHAKKVKLAEDALFRMREQLALDVAADQENGTEGSRTQGAKGAAESEIAGSSAPDAQFLSRLTKQAADFAVLAQTVTELQRQLSEERTRHEETVKTETGKLNEREAALAQRASEASKRFDAATLQLNTDRESLTRAQEEFAVAKKEFAESQLKLEAATAKLRGEIDALALARQEQSRISTALDQRSAELAKREASLEHVSKEADDVRQQGIKLRNERLALDAKVAALEAREKGLEEKRLAFEECRRNFRDTFSSFMKE